MKVDVEFVRNRRGDPQRLSEQIVRQVTGRISDETWRRSIAEVSSGVPEAAGDMASPKRGEASLPGST